MKKKTKILCTIGPASMDPSILKKMIDAGMNAIRINTSHGDFQQYRQIISGIRSLAEAPVLLDTKGPEVRVRCDRAYPLKTGDPITIGFDKSHEIWFDYDFSDKVKPGTTILVNDGLLHLKVAEKLKGALKLTALNTEVLSHGKRLNLPEITLGLPVLSKRDIEVLKFAADNRIEYVALSFVSNVRDIRQAKRLLKGSNVKLIAKIENLSGVKNFAGILDEVDGIMVARGDLGIEIPGEKLPMIQKRIIKECNCRGKVVITATQMLRSMVSSPVPTRAETSDVANAILDGTDAVMLSEESAIGNYPVEAVAVMSRIAREVEPHIPKRRYSGCTEGISDAISRSVIDLSLSLPINKIVTVTRTGYTAALISRFRLKQNIIAVTKDEMTRNQLALYYGVVPVSYHLLPGRQRVPAAASYLLENGYLQEDDLVLFTAGSYSKGHSTNLIEIHRVEDLLEYKE